ncbi:unnamed protein product [Cylicocyclus nassatus]|uniref:Uncharacterized protein n=1 Tax=Cylicocyclus nassatus TaxID=53992 RepID=A0AA36GMC1_CYLNA|nr:unnamed protein product [Cylicocyclus nassatus]
MGRNLKIKDAMQRGEEPGTSYDHKEEDALERESSAIDVMQVESTPKFQAIQSFEATKAAKQGTSRTATPKATTSTCYTQLGDEAFKEWQEKVEIELKYYRKLDGRKHPLLKEFEEYISEALVNTMLKPSPDALARKGNLLKNGTWGYVACINRFMLAAMRARKRINQTVTVDDAIYSCEFLAYMRRLKTEGMMYGSTCWSEEEDVTSVNEWGEQGSKSSSWMKLEKGFGLDQKLCIGLRGGKVSSEEGDIVSLVLQASSFTSLKQFERPPMDNDEGLVQYIVSL